MCIAYLLGNSLNIGITFVGGLIGLIILLFCIAYPKFGFYLLYIIVFFVSFFERLLNTDLHVGLMPKAFTGAILIGILLKKIIHHHKILLHANNPITYAYLIYLTYIGLEVFNPNINSPAGWGPVFSGSILIFLFYICAIFIFNSKREIKFFLNFWLVLAFITALYGCCQQWFGLPSWEYQRLLEDPHTYALFYQNGFLRKYSFLADPPSFGILMATSGILSFFLALDNTTTKKRILLTCAGTVMILSMSYSGTRMATAVIAFGIVFFSMLTIQNKKTILLLSTSLIIGIVVMFLPVYGNGVLIRIRSTFRPQDDPSMQVREVNRMAIRPYMHSHPIGGGLNTTGGGGLEYYPSHPLAGFPPDGTFMQTALEQGWIGLIVSLMVMFCILKYGVHKYYRATTFDEKIVYASILSVIFSWYMAQYSQTGQGAFNIVYLYMASLAILVRYHSLCISTE